jgi:SAM-dependent methyltransferase
LNRVTVSERSITGPRASTSENAPGTERFFRAGYRGNLVSSWLPALEGSVEKLERGAKVADVGCGLGASTILMAQAYPKSRFFGYDSHAASIELARKRAAEAGVADRVTFDGAAPPTSRAATTTSSATSTVCTTWRTRPAQHATSARRSGATATG